MFMFSQSRWRLLCLGIFAAAGGGAGAQGADLACRGQLPLCVQEAICGGTRRSRSSSCRTWRVLSTSRTASLRAPPRGPASWSEHRSSPRPRAQRFRSPVQRTLIFWAVVLMQLTQNTLWQACHMHLLDVLALKGLGSETAAAFYATVALARTLVSLAFGFWVVDRFGRRGYLLFLIGAFPMLVVVLLLLGVLGPSPWHRSTAVVLGSFYGVWGGVNSTAGSTVYAQLFGREHIGAITGLALGAMRVSGAIGPLLFGAMRDMTGSYDFPLQVLTVFTVISCLLWCVPLPQPPEHVPEHQPSECHIAVIGNPAQLDDVADAEEDMPDEIGKAALDLKEMVKERLGSWQEAGDS